MKEKKCIPMYTLRNVINLIDEEILLNECINLG